MTDVPRDPAAITSDWLTDALRDGGLDVRVAGIEATTIAEGEGFMGRLARLRVTYEKGSGPEWVVAKLPSDEPGAVVLAQLLRLWEREARFYVEIAPTLPVRTPRCYFAGGDEASGSFALVLEDLTELQCGDQVAGLTPDQAERAVDWLARFHAAWWAEEGAMDRFSWLPRVATDPMYQGLQPMLEAVWPKFAAEYGSRAPGRTLGLVESLIPKFSELLAEELLPETIIHSDYRPDNLFFGRDEVVPIDWQSVAFGQALYDLSYLIAGGLPTGVRRERERELVERYRRLVEEAGVELPGGDALFDLYRKGVLVVMAVGALLAGQLDLAANPRGVQLANLSVERTYTAGADLGVEEFGTD